MATLDEKLTILFEESDNVAKFLAEQGSNFVKTRPEGTAGDADDVCDVAIRQSFHSQLYNAAGSGKEFLQPPEQLLK